MAGLPHFTNSAAGVKLYEPVYLNQFEVLITPPAAVLGGPILVEQVTSISGLGVDKTPAATQQKYKFAVRNYAGAKPESTVFDLTVNFTVNLNDATTDSDGGGDRFNADLWYGRVFVLLATNCQR